MAQDVKTQLAELLKQDTISSQGSSSHASAENAFVASLATHALERIEALLKPAK